MRSTGDGTGRPARLPSNRVNRWLRRAEMTVAPTRCGHRRSRRVILPRPGASGGGVPARWQGRRRAATRRRRRRRVAPTAGRRTAGRAPTTAGPRAPTPGRAPTATAPARRCGGGRRSTQSRWCAAPPAPRGGGGAGAPPAGLAAPAHRRSRPARGRGAGSRRARLRGRTLGQAEHHHQVEVEPDAHLDRADQHALAQATDPTQVVVELDLDRAVEDIEGTASSTASSAPSRWSDCSTRSAAFRSSILPALTAGGAAEQPGEPALGPGCVLAPPAGPSGLVEIVDDRERERPQILGPPGVCTFCRRATGLVVVGLGLGARHCRAAARAGGPSRRGRPPRRPHGRAAPCGDGGEAASVQHRCRGSHARTS